MTKLDDWPRVKRVLEEALARDDTERQAYVADACGTDSGLRSQVETLLASSAQAGEFLETPAAMLLDPPSASREQIGRVVSSYQLMARLGAGGMGEVYRARDARLDRDVALKLLPDAFAANADRIARFKREAQLLASLNHSHIGAIYGFEEDAGTYALVLELVEGPTLADRIAQGPLPLDEALPIAREIAEALEAAHEQRIIHRDLKPANIKLRPDGLVKVLDFGLAEAFDPSGSAESGGFAGTAAYMSPEQVRGKSIDKRCDIWAFGCVLYEMLTGRRPFEGQDVPEVLARVVEQEPEFDALPAATPVPIRRLLRRCLEKDRRKRLPDIGVARIEIDDALAAPDETPPSRVRPAWMIAAALAGAVIVGVALYSRTPPAKSPPLVRASIPLEGQLDFAVQQLAFAVSPDGMRIAYRTVGGGPLRIRQLHDAQSSTIAGTEDASTPFLLSGWSLARLFRRPGH